MERVNQSEITAEAADRSGIAYEDARAVVQQFVLSMQDALLAGKRVNLSGFVSMGTRNRRSRVGRNPRTGESVRVPPGRSLFVKTSTSFRKDLNSKRKARSDARAKPITAARKPVKKTAVKKTAVKAATPKKKVAKKTAVKPVAKAKKTAAKKVAKKVAKKAPVKRVAKKAAPKKKAKR